MTLVYMFPGQGTQRAGMGGDLFDRFRAMTAVADAVLGYSVADLCLHDPHERLGLTIYTQPAVYVVNALSYAAARADGSAVPDVAVGHSLGEYNALETAGVFGFADGLQLVVARATAMARVRDGGMCAVLGMDEAVIRLLLRRAGLEAVEVANHNTQDQTILGGPVAKLESAAALLKDSGARAVRRLPVSGPFHTGHMSPAAEEFGRLLARTPLAAPAFPVIANRTALPYTEATMADVLREQIDHPVLWRQTVESLLDSDADTVFEEAGDSTVLTRMLRSIRAERDTR
ncbi:acyltransferase domain-containing protein [Streptomyces sp. H27-H1]|uniref:ACP S-malonyltransferase n=1 Tax=Streptomyces sp. H27-H1 TaxID=2996461 RepID=UPI0022716C16|nr:acyltransferase domain-containing protein [Streptomyces sp. H27-H1]MCY0927953.1 acyltransferase domain-containing protein [Streptomyces sp. H27-H1]